MLRPKLLILCLTASLLLVAGNMAYGQMPTGQSVHSQSATHASSGAQHIATADKHSQGFDDKAALDYSQAALGRVPGDYALLDRAGHSVHLSSYRGKPLVISFIYSSCFHICPALTQNLARAAEAARSTVGDDSFSLISIGFDYPRDRPETMRTFARQQGVSNEPNWAFLSTPDMETVQHLTRELGFIFYASPKGFDHLSQITVIDAGGKVYRQVYGMDFGTPMLVEPLKELIFGNPAREISLSSFISKVRLWCTVYDPATESYRFNYAMIMGLIVSIITLVLIGIFIFRMWFPAAPSGDS